MFSSIINTVSNAGDHFCEYPLASIKFVLRYGSVYFSVNASIFADSSELLGGIRAPVAVFLTGCCELGQLRNDALEQLNADMIAELVAANEIIVNPNGEITPKDPLVMAVGNKFIKDMHDLKVSRSKYEFLSQVSQLGCGLLETIQPNLEEFDQKFRQKIELRNNRFSEIHAQYVAECDGLNQTPPIDEAGVGDNQEQDDEEVQEQGDIQNAYEEIAIPPPPPPAQPHALLDLDTVVTQDYGW